jgi:hypothetical protein
LKILSTLEVWLRKELKILLNISAVKTAIDELLEHYRQALLAVEYLPSSGPVPSVEFFVDASPSDASKSKENQAKTFRGRKRTIQGDWFRIRFAIRFLARMFLRSHIRSKLRTIADRLEVERLASGHMDPSELKQLDDIIKELRYFDDRLWLRSLWWLKPVGWIWAIALPLLITYLTTLLIQSHGISATGILATFVSYLLFFGMIVYAPLFICGALGGFRWKRLILVGQIGDANIDIATNAKLHWLPAPESNTYQAENQLFEILGLPKPSEFPWDLVFTPTWFLLAVLALSALILAIALVIPMQAVEWLVLVPIALLIIFFMCLHFLLHHISKIKRERSQRELTKCYNLQGRPEQYPKIANNEVRPMIDMRFGNNINQMDIKRINSRSNNLTDCDSFPSEQSSLNVIRRDILHICYCSQS